MKGIATGQVRRCLTAVFLFFLVLVLSGCPGEDLLPPRARIASPADGDTVFGQVGVVVYAVDDRGISRVEMFVDDSLLESKAGHRDSLYEFGWDVTTYPAGSEHRLRVRVLDRRENSASSGEVRVVTFPLPGTYHSGTISQDERWRASGNPHYVTGNLMIEALVEVEPGVEVIFNPGARVTVGMRAGGGIRAIGTSAVPIRWTGTAWNGMRFLNFSDRDNNVLRYCVIEGVDTGAIITVAGARVTVENCSLRGGGGDGVVCAGGEFGGFTGNVITGCAGFPLVIDAQGAGTIGAGNVFQNNGQHFIEITGGEVKRSVTWNTQAVPYLITGTVTVAGDSSPILTIAAGCSLLFADSVRLRCGAGKPGGIVADGGLGEIVFTAGRDCWRGLEFWDRALSQSRLKNCRIEKGGAGGIAAVLTYVPISITGCRIVNSVSAGIYCVGCGFVQFEYNTVSGCARYPLHIEAGFVSTLGQGNNLGFNNPAFDFIYVPAGEIVQDGVWLNQGVPYYVDGLVEVGSALAPLLSIAPGVRIKFAANSGIRVGDRLPGKLVAVGVPESIVFTGDSAVPGAWRGIDFGAFTASGSILDHCQLLYGGGGGVMALVVVRNCNPTITNNEIGYSAKYCIALFNSALEPERLRQENWLHHWGEEYEDIYDEGP